jgi:hypothetical protein
MKNFLFLAIAALLFTGCAGIDLINEVPQAEFKRFEYHRGGNCTSAHITAIDSKLVDGVLEIGEIQIQADYGPAVNWNITLEGYKRIRGGAVPVPLDDPDFLPELPAPGGG